MSAKANAGARTFLFKQEGRTALRISAFGLSLGLRTPHSLCFHPHRAAGGHRDHCDSGRPAAARPFAGQRALRVNCASNLKQLGLGIHMYATDNNEIVPHSYYGGGDYPYLTYVVADCAPGTGNVTIGFHTLGLLWRTKNVANGKVFYCPS